MPLCSAACAMPPQCLRKPSATNDEFDRLAHIARRREISCSTRKHVAQFRARFDKHPNLENARPVSSLSPLFGRSAFDVVSFRQSPPLFFVSPIRPLADSPIRPASIPWRLELGEFFFRVGYIGFVGAAKLKQSL